ncbi:MAG: glycosyltransferase [Candidatus Thorarchaeota archaeon]
MSDKKASVSAALIVRNEAKTLEMCLKSIRDYVEEIVVLVDNRTTDQSYEIATRLADKVQYFKWHDDFAGARNEAIALCSHEWILIMDGHEVLHPKSGQILENLKGRVVEGGDLETTGRFDAFVYMDPKGKDADHLIPTSFFLQPRLFRKEAFRYRGRIHNFLEPTSEKAKEYAIRPVNELVFLHSRPEELSELRKQERREINIRILKEEIEKDPDYARAYFYLAQTYYEAEMYDDALETYQKYIEKSSWDAEKAHAYLMMATIYAEMKQFEEARECCYKGIGLDWGRAEFYLTLGDIAYEEKDFYQAQHWYTSAKDKKPPMNGLFLHGASYTYAPYVKLAKLYSTVGEWMDALTSARTALELGADEPDMVQKMPLWEKYLGLKEDAKNVLFFDENNSFTFLNGITARLSGKYNVATASAYDPTHAYWANYLWVEWCANGAAQITTLQKPKHQKWIIRLHGYEIFSPHRIDSTDWSKVDALVFVADHIRKRFNERYWLPKNVKIVTIPNGVDVDRWDFAKREYSSSKNIGIIGILSEKKGPLLLAKVIRYFAKAHPEYKFLLRLDVLNSPDVNEGMLKYELRDLDNWEWVPRQESLNTWMEDLKYLLSTSILESFSYVIAEAMAKGIKPLIHDFFGSRDLWPENLIWRDLEELDALLDQPYESDAYRQWVKERYSLDTQVQRIEQLFADLKGEEK